MLARLAAELGLRFDDTGAYTGRAGPLAAGGAGTPHAGGIVGRGDADATAATVQEILRRHSLVDGVEPDLVAVTAWAQPWIPLWVEYEVAVEVATRRARLAARRRRPRTGRAAPGLARTMRTRDRPGAADHGAGRRARRRRRRAGWSRRTQRDQHDQGEADPATEAALADLAKAADGLDLVGRDARRRPPESARAGASTVRARREPTAAAIPPTPTGPVDLLAARHRRAAADPAGRRVRPHARAGRRHHARPDPAGPGIRRRGDAAARPPRFSAPTRCRLRLVGAATLDATAAVDARIDEVRPARQVSPGVRLPAARPRRRVGRGVRGRR